MLIRQRTEFPLSATALRSGLPRRKARLGTIIGVACFELAAGLEVHNCPTDEVGVFFRELPKQQRRKWYRASDRRGYTLGSGSATKPSEYNPVDVLYASGVYGEDCLPEIQSL
jgi:hypothetical protein